jgi:hypothetical protein
MVRLALLVAVVAGVAATTASAGTATGFRCVSRATGLACTNTRGHGWFLSRESWRVH